MTKKNIISMVLSTTLVITMLSACQTADQNESLVNENGDEIVEVTAVLQINPEVSLENNPILDRIEEETGVRLVIEAPPVNGYFDRVKILVGTGDMPDFFAFGADTYAAQWAEEGLLADVTDLISNYPNLSSNITEEQYGDMKLLGNEKIYGIPRPNSYDKQGFLINKKWLDAVGMEVPCTVNEFLQVCRAFTNEDPDGNGVDDTYGVSFGAQQNSLDSGIWHMNNDFLSTAYNIAAWHHAMPDVDGNYQLRPFKSKYYDYMTLLKEMYAEGIIDKEFITHKASEHIEKFAQNRVGIVGASEKNYTTEILEKYSLNPDDYVFCPPLILEKGQDPVYVMPPSNWMGYFINAKSPNIEAVLKVLDWANSEEGFTTMQLGLEGEHYNNYDIETRTVDRTEEQVREVTKVTSNMFAFANAYQGKEVLQGGSRPEMIEKWQKESAEANSVTVKCYTPFVKMVDQIAVDFPDDVQTLNNLEVRYVTGEVSLEELKAFAEGDYQTKTKEIAAEFQEYMRENPVKNEK